jgi:hypothetical protein
LHRGKNEAQNIAAATTINQVIDYMKQRPDPLNHRIIVEKMVQFGTEAIDRILQEYSSPMNTTFLEIGIKILYRLKIENDKLRILITNGPRKAYMISLLCMLLGFNGTSSDVSLLWKYYNFFSGKFQMQTYSEGPLLGLLEIKARMEEESSIRDSKTERPIFKVES